MHAESVIDMSEAGIRDRTKEGFQELVLAELPALYSLARRLVRDGAEDLVQEALLQVFESEDLREVLIRLPDIYRIPLVLRYMDGFATKEIARLLEAPRGTILARLHRGRRLLEREMWTYAQEAGLLTKER